MKKLWASLQQEKRRYLLIVFFVFVAIGLVRFATYLAISSTDDRWEEFSEQKTSEIIDQVRASFARIEFETSRVARQVHEHPLVSSFLVKGEAPRQELFSFLENLRVEEDVGIEVFDRNLSLIAWRRKQVGIDSSDLHQNFGKLPASFVSRSSLYTFLTILLPISGKDGELVGVVAASRPVEVNYPLNNRFLTSKGVQSELSDELGTNVRIEFGVDAEPSKDGRIASAELFGQDEKKIGMVHIDRPVRTSYLQSMEGISDSIVSVLVALLSVVVLFGVWRYLREWPPMPFAVLFLLLLWAARYAWLGFGFPSLLLQEGIFDPSHFASPFGLGLTKSIGELLITSIFLLISSIFLIAISVQSGILEKPTLKKTSGIRGFVVAFLAGGLVMLLARAYAEAIRSSVFDSKLKFIDPTTIVPYPLLAAMLLGILLLSISFLLVGTILFLLSVRWSNQFLTAVGLEKFPPWLFVVLLFGLESVLFGFLHPSPQTSQIYRLVFLGLLASFSILLRYERKSSGRAHTGKVFAAAMGISIFIATPVLDAKIHEHDREVLRLYVTELTRPADTWIQLVLEESLNEMISDEEAKANLVSQDRDLVSGIAFKLWARTGLSREGFNSAVAILRAGKIESLFNLGLQRSEVHSLISSLGSLPNEGMFLARSAGDIRGLDRYVGTAPVLSPERKVLANVVAIASGQRMLLRTETPEILQVPSSLSLETQFRNLIVSEFLGRSLLRSTGEKIVSDYRMPEGIYSALTVGEAPYAWADEKIGGEDYHSVYIRLGTEQGAEKFLGLSMEAMDVRWHIFNLLKVVFFYLLIGVIIAGGYGLHVALTRKEFRLSFRGKLLTALLSLATIPLLVLSYYDRKFTEESRLEILRHQAEDELRVVSSNLINHLGSESFTSVEHSLTDSLCERVAQETGIDFNIYLGKSVRASSRPELYDAELIDSRMSNSAYRAIMLEGTRFFLQTESIGRYPYLVGYRRIEDSRGQSIGAISVLTTFKHQSVDQELFKRSAFVFSAYAVIMLLVVSVGIFFAFRIASPIKRLTGAMTQVARGDLDTTLEVQSKDELGELVAAFNKMTRDLKRIQRELAAAERELAWREMAKQVAHEIKNPLTPMRLSIQHLRQAYRDRVKDFQNLLENVSATIIDQVDSLGRIATEFSRYARMPERKYELCDLHSLILEAVRLFDQEKGIHFETDLADGNPTIIADREELRRVFINVLRNAVQAIVGSGEVCVKTCRRDGDLEIEIADTGRGIPDEIRSRLFEPNFSTKSEGMGLGLAISKQTILDLKGRIEIESTVGKGTRVIIILPVHSTS